MKQEKSTKLFDYKALRLLIGLIAFLLPFAVYFLSEKDLSSISASYYTEARDAFVGMLAIVGTLMFTYKGNKPSGISESRLEISQATSSKIAGIAGLIVAFFPAARDECDVCVNTIIVYSDWTPRIHYIAAGVLFSILAYFCLRVFTRDTVGQGGMKERRARIYKYCGWGIIVSMIALFIAHFVPMSWSIIPYDFTFYAEWFALFCFGVAWIVSGKWLPIIADKEEALLIIPRMFDPKIR